MFDVLNSLAIREVIRLSLPFIKVRTPLNIMAEASIVVGSSFAGRGEFSRRRGL